MNIFEGARRIAALGTALVFVGGAVAIYNINPHVNISYRVLHFGLTPLRLNSCDSSVDAVRYTQHTTPSGREYSIRTCFKASRADNGKLLIPYVQAPDNMVYMDSEFSGVVQAYTESVSDGITPTPEDIKDADDEYIRQSWAERLKGFGWLLVALFAYWAAVRIVGWVLRGFMGIPSGQDFRPKSP